MAVDIDDDTLQAVIRCWNDDATLPGLFSEPIRAGRLKSSEAGARPIPYAQVASEPQSREIIGSDGNWQDWRKVTIKVWGTKAQASQTLAVLLARFNLRLGKAGQPTLRFPSEARFMQWTPLEGGGLAQDQDTTTGLDVWVATVTATVWTIRNE